MSLSQIDHDIRILKRNNGLIRYVAKSLPEAQTVVIGTYDAVWVSGDRSVLGLTYHGWTIELDFTNTDDYDDISASFCKEKELIQKTCKHAAHLLNAVKKYCV